MCKPWTNAYVYRPTLYPVYQQAACSWTFQLGYLLWIGCLLASLQLTDYYETLINLNTNYYKIVYRLHYKLLVLQYRLHYKSLQTCYWFQYKPLQTCVRSSLQTITDLNTNYYNSCESFIQSVHRVNWHHIIRLKSIMLLLATNHFKLFTDFITNHYWPQYKPLQTCYWLQYKLLQTCLLTSIHTITNLFTDFMTNHYWPQYKLLQLL